VIKLYNICIGKYKQFILGTYGREDADRKTQRKRKKAYTGKGYSENTEHIDKTLSH
jgi:hypothetical protein